jgi:hypothetical protein
MPQKPKSFYDLWRLTCLRFFFIAKAFVCALVNYSDSTNNKLKSLSLLMTAAVAAVVGGAEIDNK